ncbi:MAG: 3-isopropylmalate dehydratase [Deltaproteobacteria bacterium]|nr:3-isopropylmalate dehydratase [Deltaproteobacteria bacterium]
MLRTVSRSITLRGRILYLTADLELLAAQLKGRDLDWDPARPRIDNISTDEITPAWSCYYYDETLARFCLVGLRGGVVDKDAIKNGGFEVLVAGRSKGCGSSRETAPFAELTAGIKLVIADSFEKIYLQNCQNVGLLTSTDLGLVPRILRGEAIDLEELSRDLDPISAAIVEHGGLFGYARARMSGQASPPEITTAPRPMTVAEKILARHAIVDAQNDVVGVPAVAPGDALFVRTDVRFSHDYVTAMADALFRRGFGEEARVEQPERVFAFRDHLTFLSRVMPEKHRRLGLLEQSQELATVQEAFAKRQGVKLYGEVEGHGSYGICHNVVLEEIARPGDLVIGTDSHTCTAGAISAFAFGVGSTDMAVAWRTRDVRVRVPETIEIVLDGALSPDACAKDVMLHLLALPLFKTGGGIGRVLEVKGPGVATLSLDERATIANMAVEGGGFTAVFEGERDDLRADAGATYHARIVLDLSSVEPMVATPGDPRNGEPLRGVDRVPVDIAYGGSCTGGKAADMDLYARVLRGRRVKDGVRLYIQFGSQKVRQYAEQQGYVKLFEEAGAELIDPSCGACIHAGPGISERKGQITVSAINRNFPGRSGPGDVYLASPLVVAASAVAGRLSGPGDLPPMSG